ncbi:COMM domain-containing protein 5 [Exaiptasia diaphana]|uniref:COMM domain-containing protein 5 n=1 Tax=Exaiptasia diaphana TaxID=2652724 RepID=A0A913XVZ2_EXADI|nr:COMM domain-containing protein 5 [Exaiptasia diaphana]
MTSHLKSLDKQVFRKILQVIVTSLEGKPVEDGVLQKIAGNNVSEDVVGLVFAGIYTILTSALRLPLTSLKLEQFQADLAEIRIPAELIPDLSSIVFGERRSELDNAAISSGLPKLDSLRWRVDVAISTSALNRVLEPSILMETQLSNGSIQTFEVPLSKFHQLRYNVAYVLKEMEDVEHKNILKIQD